MIRHLLNYIFVVILVSFGPGTASKAEPDADMVKAIKSIGDDGRAKLLDIVLKCDTYGKNPRDDTYKIRCNEAISAFKVLYGGDNPTLDKLMESLSLTASAKEDAVAIETLARVYSPASNIHVQSNHFSDDLDTLRDSLKAAR